MEIQIISADDKELCPQCQKPGNGIVCEVAHDEDGPIYETECDTHGAFRFQVIDE